ncbi:MAG: J domain-containing protein [Epsilonproteobacteria bacterium]|nr:J domain-containing protein [Campylobacterota bacterium]
MKVKQTKSQVNVIIDNDIETFCYLKDLVEKNLKNRLIGTDKIIVFNDVEEKIGRKYFLKFLSRIYAKKTHKKLKKIWQIEKAFNKIIKISLSQKNQIRQVVKISVSYKKSINAVEISTDKNNRALSRGIKNFFKGYKVVHYPSLNTVCIYDIDENFGKLLRDFISTKEIPGLYLDITYDKEIFKTIKAENIKKISKNRKRAELLLEDYYKKLHCSCADPYEKVRQNYLSLVKKYHPDTLSNDNEIILKVYKRKFQEIQQAYKTIKEYHKYLGDVA